MAADARTAPRPLHRELLGSGRGSVGCLTPQRPPADAGGRDAGRADRSEADSSGLAAGRLPRVPWVPHAQPARTLPCLPPSWALIGRDPDS